MMTFTKQPNTGLLPANNCIGFCFKDDGLLINDCTKAKIELSASGFSGSGSFDFDGQTFSVGTTNTSNTFIVGANNVATAENIASMFDANYNVSTNWIISQTGANVVLESCNCEDKTGFYDDTNLTGTLNEVVTNGVATEIQGDTEYIYQIFDANTNKLICESRAAINYSDTQIEDTCIDVSNDIKNLVSSNLPCFPAVQNVSQSGISSYYLKVGTAQYIGCNPVYSDFIKSDNFTVIDGAINYECELNFDAYTSGSTFLNVVTGNHICDDSIPFLYYPLMPSSNLFTLFVKYTDGISSEEVQVPFQNQYSILEIPVKPPTLSIDEWQVQVISRTNTVPFTDRVLTSIRYTKIKCECCDYFDIYFKNHLGGFDMLRFCVEGYNNSRTATEICIEKYCIENVDKYLKYGKGQINVESKKTISLYSDACIDDEKIINEFLNSPIHLARIKDANGDDRLIRFLLNNSSVSYKESIDLRISGYFSVQLPKLSI